MAQTLRIIYTMVVVVAHGFLMALKDLSRSFKGGFRHVFRKSIHARPACLDDASLGTHGFLHLEDVKIHYVASGPEDKPLMLFVHGFPEFWYSWRHQIQHFQKSYRCVAIDQRGYGESDKPKGIQFYQMKYLMKDIKQIITALGYKSCTLVAHDWGGAVAWAFASGHADMVDRLVIMNVPPGPVMKELFLSNIEQAKNSWYAFFFQLPRLPELFLGLDDCGFFDRFGTSESGDIVNPISAEDIKAYKYTYSQSGAWTPPINFYRASTRHRPKPYEMKYSMPVLLVWGLRDKFLSSAVVDEVEKVVPGVTVKRLPDAGHFVQMDTPDKVNQIVQEWLAKE